MAVADVPAEARIRPAVKQAWTNIWPNFWWLLLFGLLAGLATNISIGQTVPVSDAVMISVNTLGGLVAIFVGIPLSMGVVKAHLVASRGEKPTWSDLGYAFGPRYWSSLGLGVLSALIVIGGLILLILPGIYLAVKLAFAPVRWVEDGLGAVDAIKASFEDVKGRWWNVFGLALMGFLLFLAGLVALVVGVFVSMVLVSQMTVVYWRALAENEAPTAAGWTEAE